VNPRIASIENLIATDPGERNVFGLVVADQLRLAAQSLRLAKRVGIVSGFFVRTGAVHQDAPYEGAGETDGPPGAKVVGSALKQLGIKVDYLTDQRNAALFRALGLDPVVDASHYLDDARPTHLLAIERIGRGADGRYRNMRGVDITDTTAPLDELFLEGSRRGLTTIGIGDGGNEIGMGKVFVDVLDTADRTMLGGTAVPAVAQPPGPPEDHALPPEQWQLATIVSTDFCIAAGVSNWGAYGLAGALSVLEGTNLLPSAEEAARDIELLVRDGGAIDGVTHRREPTVDGLHLSHSIRILENIRRLVAPSPLGSARSGMGEHRPDVGAGSLPDGRVSDPGVTDWKVGGTEDSLLVGVLGYGETGRAAVALLTRRGHRVCLSEHGTITVDRGTVLAGVETGGHTIDFLRECDLVVASPGVRADAEIRNALHLCGIPVMSELELAYQLLVGTADPACGRELIAVTGTIGKRTTVELLQELFRLAGRPLMIGGNRGRPLSALILDADAATADPRVRESRRAGIAPAKAASTDPAVREGIHAPANNGESVPQLAVAVSSFQLETVVNFRPHVAIMLNIDEAHLDRHRTVAEYVRIKSRIFMNQRPDDVLILTFDDPRLRPLARKHQGRTFFVSGRQEVDRGAWLLDGMVYMNIRGKVDQLGPAQTPFPENLLASIVTAHVCGISTEEIAAALPKLPEGSRTL
jgi:UDP-N-acetylmuramoylalanine-D-glutamate ligase